MPYDGPKMAPDGPKMASRSFKMHQQKPANILGKIDILAIKMLEHVPKMTPTWPQDDFNMAPRWFQDAP